MGTNINSFIRIVLSVAKTQYAAVCFLYCRPVDHSRRDRHYYVAFVINHSWSKRLNRTADERAGGLNSK